MNNDNYNYNYESPITCIQNQLLKEMVKKEEDQFMCEVRQTIGYNIDKAELIKALNYNRDQYDKGYQDGRSAGYRQVIDILEAYKPSGNIYNGYNSIEEKIDERICYLIDEIIGEVKREPDDDNKWIKCSEKMPEPPKED